MKFSTSLAAAAFVLSAGAASAVTSVIDLSGHAGLASSHSYNDYGSGGSLGLTVTGHLINSDGSIKSDEKVGQYSGGLGVTNNDECKFGYCGWDSHLVDSVFNDEGVKFAFSQEVTVKKIWFTYVDKWDDFAFSIFDGSSVDSFTPDNDISGGGFWGVEGDLGWYSFAEPRPFSDTFIVGAFDTGWFDKATDQFKIKKIKVHYEPNVVPLPAAGWLLLAGLGGLAAYGRKKRAA